MPRPLLDGFELQQVQNLVVDGDRVLVEHGIPALEGDFLQQLGRRAARVDLTGVLTGPESSESLKTLREKFRKAEPVDFVTDIAAATQVGQVLIERMNTRELAGRPERFLYAFRLREFLPPTAVAREELTIQPPPQPLTVDEGTLIVDVTVEGQPGFDFSRVTVSVSGTQSDGTDLSRQLVNRADNRWTEELPPGSYTVQAQVGEPDPLTGSQAAQVSSGQTTQVTIALRPGSTIAHFFILHLRFDNSMIEPCLRGVLRRAVEYSNQHPDEKLLMVGHTDKAGTVDYNQSLSERRARSVFAFLTFGRDATSADEAVEEWDRHRRQGSGLPRLEDDWGTFQYQYLLQDLGFYPGNINGRHDNGTDTAVRTFQHEHGLGVDGDVGDQTWPVLIREYLRQDSLDMPESRFFTNCDPEVLKWLGCGELDPLKNTDDPWRPSRRVELLFVRADHLPCEVPPPVTFNLPRTGAVNSNWCLGSQGPRCCFVSPHLIPEGNDPQPCPNDPLGPWCRHPAEPGQVLVQGVIAHADGTPLANARYALIAPDGTYLHTDTHGQPDLGEHPGGPNRGTAILSRTDANGRFSHPVETPLGVYTLDIREDVVVRLADEPGMEAKGNVVCKFMDGSSDFNVLVCGSVATTFDLEVEGATRIGGAASTTFVTSMSDDFVLITVVTPSGTCPAPRSIIWSGGQPVPQRPLQRHVPRSSIGTFPVTAEMPSHGVTRSVDIVVVRVTLDVDTDRDGVVQDGETGKDNWQFGAGNKGAVILCNSDNDDRGVGNLTPDRENIVVDGGDDVADLALLIVRRSGTLPAGLSLVLTVDDKSKIRIFDQRSDTATAIIGPDAALPSEVAVANTASADVEMGMEATQYPDGSFDGILNLALVLREGPTEIARDPVQVRVAPWIMSTHLDRSERLFVVEIPGFNTTPRPFMDDLEAAATAAGVPLQKATGSTYIDPGLAFADPWMQDTMEIGYSRMPGNQFHVVLDAVRTRGLDQRIGATRNNFGRDELLGPNFGYNEVPTGRTENSFDSHGNLECTPPVTITNAATGQRREFKLGRIYFGGQSRTIPMGPITVVREFNPEVRAFLEAQRVQSPFSIDTTWLAVGHVDEVVSFVPASGSPNFRLLLADTDEAFRILRDLRTRGFGSRRILRSTSEARTINAVLGDAALISDNAFCQTKIRTVESEMVTNLGLDPTRDIVRIPTIYAESRFSPRLGDPTADPQFAAWMPNLVNLLMITGLSFSGHRLAVPRPFGPVLSSGSRDVFEQDFINRLTPLGYTASQIHFIDDFVNYHLGDGEVHCATNTRRTPPVAPWWEQTDT